MGDFNGDGVEEIFIGAPGFSIEGFSQMGAVFLESIDNSDEDISPYLVSNEPYTRFGYALAALDINRDGIDDLVVSAPAQGKGGPTELLDYYPKSYTGRVYIYFGVLKYGIKRGA